jgi:TRAP-type mannitol/chloroaromatic compound transport system permease large subunit
MYRAVIPFIVIQLIGLILITVFPQMVTTLVN